MGVLSPKVPSEYPSVILYLLDQQASPPSSSRHAPSTRRTLPSGPWDPRSPVCPAPFLPLLGIQYLRGDGDSLAWPAKCIKHLIRDPRPLPPATAANPSPRTKTSYGMPSTHSTALTFIYVYLFPLTPTLTAYTASALGIHDSTMLRSAIRLALTAYWLGGLWSRVELGYHDPMQVLGGVVLGVAMAGGWRVLWETMGGSTGAWGRWGQSWIDYLWDGTLGRVF
ncbi:hypothetical protein P7C73_g5532, partial [Tremellales sp. Uapishka_1]